MNFEARIEKTETGYSAHVPGLPGCIAAGETREVTERLINEAIDFHLEGMMLRNSVVVLASIEAASDVALLWITDNTPLLYVEIAAPRSAAILPPKIQTEVGVVAGAAA